MVPPNRPDFTSEEKVGSTLDKFGFKLRFK